MRLTGNILEIHDAQHAETTPVRGEEPGSPQFCGQQHEGARAQEPPGESVQPGAQSTIHPAGGL